MSLILVWNFGCLGVIVSYYWLSIWNFCSYNPNKFADDDDDVSDMEAGFEDIQREERRR